MWSTLVSKATMRQIAIKLTSQPQSANDCHCKFQIGCSRDEKVIRGQSEGFLSLVQMIT
jgi:hypothetical protein